MYFQSQKHHTCLDVLIAQESLSSASAECFLILDLIEMSLLLSIQSMDHDTLIN